MYRSDGQNSVMALLAALTQEERTRGGGGLTSPDRRPSPRRGPWPPPPWPRLLPHGTAPWRTPGSASRRSSPSGPYRTPPSPSAPSTRRRAHLSSPQWGSSASCRNLASHSPLRGGIPRRRPAEGPRKRGRTSLCSAAIAGGMQGRR